jgi:hypothetical protein
MKQTLSFGQCPFTFDFDEIQEIAQQKLVNMMTQASYLTFSSFWKNNSEVKTIKLNT